MKKLTIKDFEVTEPTPYVSWDELDRVMGKRMYNKFLTWSLGQTCVPGGVNPWDVDRFLRGLPNLD